jgi:hypothetical protein
MAQHLLTGVDNLKAACNVILKEYRLRKLQALPGWKLQMNLREGIKLLMDWYRDMRDQAKVTVAP